MASDHARPRRFERFPGWAVLLVFCLLFPLQVILSHGQESATFDEPVNLASGYLELKYGDFWLLPRNLPFVKQLAALPLLFVDVKMPATHGKTDPHIFGEKFLYQANDGDRVLFLGRLAVLPLALLLGGLVFRCSCELFGRAAGLGALFLYTFEPNVLAHSGLVTTDLALACWMFAVIYGFYQVTQRVSLLRLLLPGAALGLGLLTKFTLHPLVLILLVLGGIAACSPQPLHLGIRGFPHAEVRSRRGKLTVILVVILVWGLLAYAEIWALYRFRYEASAASGVTSMEGWSKIVPTQPFLQGLLAWARGTRILPEGYLYGFFDLLGDSGTTPAFLMGEIRDGGWWYYFLVTFLIKTPVALLLLVGLALWFHGRRWRQDPLRIAFLLLPVLIHFGFIAASGYNIGHRHLLPIFPFLFVLVSGLIPWVIQSNAWAKAGVAVLSLWYLVASVSIFPHYLAYFNELVGGPNQGYRYLVDSNLDWGQDLKGLKRYMDAHGIERVWLSYFGMADPNYYGIRYNFLPGIFQFDPNAHTEPTPFVAISATNLQGVYLGSGPRSFQEFKTRQPLAKIGYSIFVYRLE